MFLLPETWIWCHPHQNMWDPVDFTCDFPPNTISTTECHNRMVTWWMEKCELRKESFINGREYQNLGRWLNQSGHNRAHSQRGIWLLGPQLPMTSQQSEDSTKHKNFAVTFWRHFLKGITPSHPPRLGSSRDHAWEPAYSPCGSALAWVKRSITENSTIQQHDTGTQAFSLNLRVLLPSWLEFFTLQLQVGYLPHTSFLFFNYTSTNHRAAEISGTSGTLGADTPVFESIPAVPLSSHDFEEGI